MKKKFMPMIKAELELAFSKKPEATMSFAPSFVGIGTYFDFESPIPGEQPSE